MRKAPPTPTRSLVLFVLLRACVGVHVLISERQRQVVKQVLQAASAVELVSIFQHHLSSSLPSVFDMRVCIYRNKSSTLFLHAPCYAFTHALSLSCTCACMLVLAVTSTLSHELTLSCSKRLLNQKKELR